jgi:hypothetical protein
MYLLGNLEEVREGRTQTHFISQPACRLGRGFFIARNQISMTTIPALAEERQARPRA